MNVSEAQVHAAWLAIAPWVTQAQVRAALEAAAKVREEELAAKVKEKLAELEDMGVNLYEYQCTAHGEAMRWNHRPEFHMEVCPHVEQRISASGWEEVT